MRPFMSCTLQPVVFISFGSFAGLEVCSSPGYLLAGRVLPEKSWSGLFW